MTIMSLIKNTEFGQNFKMTMLSLGRNIVFGQNLKMTMASLSLTSTKKDYRHEFRTCVKFKFSDTFEDRQIFYYYLLF